MMHRAYTELRRKIVAKKERVAALEVQMQEQLAEIGNQIQPGTLLANAAMSIAQKAGTSSLFVRYALGVGVIYGADKLLFRKANTLVRTAGMLAVRKLVSNFIDNYADDRSG